jgi:hypothetical protein
LFFREPPGTSTSDQRYIREIPLLEGERVEEQYVPSQGLVSDTPVRGELLALTNKRVVSFVTREGRRETFLAPLEELRGVSLKTAGRGAKDLAQGLGLVLLGILCYFIVGYILEGVLIAAIAGAIIILGGALFLAKYLIGQEDEGTITFQGSNWELSFPYKHSNTNADVYKLINRFFQLKQDAAIQLLHLPEDRELKGDRVHPRTTQTPRPSEDREQKGAAVYPQPIQILRPSEERRLKGEPVHPQSIQTLHPSQDRQQKGDPVHPQSIRSLHPSHTR